MSIWIKALPYLIGIGGGLIGAVKWLYGALTKERDYYRTKFLEQEDKISKMQEQLAELKSKNKEQQWLIDQYVKKMPDSGTSKEENNEA